MTTVTSRIHTAADETDELILRRKAVSLARQALEVGYREKGLVHDHRIEEVISVASRHSRGEATDHELALARIKAQELVRSERFASFPTKDYVTTSADSAAIATALPDPKDALQKAAYWLASAIVYSVDVDKIANRAVREQSFGDYVAHAKAKTAAYAAATGALNAVVERLARLAVVNTVPRASGGARGFRKEKPMTTANTIAPETSDRALREQAVAFATKALEIAYGKGNGLGPDPRLEKTLEVASRFAIGKATCEELESAEQNADWIAEMEFQRWKKAPSETVLEARFLAARCVRIAASGSTKTAVEGTAYHLAETIVSAKQREIYRKIVSDIFRSLTEGLPR